jgi:hypothetical protein
MHRAIGIGLLGIFLSGCGEDERTKDGANGDDPPSGPAPYVRLDLVGAGASASLVRATSATIAADSRPVPHLAGELVALAWDGDVLREAVPVAFPTSATFEGEDDAGQPFSNDVPLDEATTTVFLREDPRVDRIEVTDVGGNVLVSLEGDALPKSPDAAAQGHTAQAELALVEDGIALEFPGIQFLSPGEEELLPKALRESIEEIVLLDLSMDEPLAEALRAIAPKARGAMSTVAVVKMPKSADGLTTLGIASGQAFVINASQFDKPGEVERTVVHENAHNYTYLVNAAASASSDLAKWPDAVQAEVKKTLSEFRLAGGISDVVASLQDTAVGMGLGLAYQGSAWTMLSEGAATDGGFATPYGSRNEREDIAELTQRVQAPATGGTPLCAALAGAGAPFPDGLVLPYAKLRLLTSLGFITEQALEDCMGTPALEGTEGIHLADTIHFTDSLQAGWLDQDGGHFLAVLGEGPNTYGLLLRVLAPEEQPLGLHRLDSISLGNLHDPNNAVYLKNDDPDKARASGGGLVLVTAANPDKIEGAIFFLSLQNGFGATTDTMALSTFLVQ